MTIFQLAIYSCVRFGNPFTDDMTTSCHWTPNGLFMTEEKCKAVAPQLGTPIFSDVADDRKVEDTRCASVFVSE
jgi:hypothetical protein